MGWKARPKRAISPTADHTEVVQSRPLTLPPDKPGLLALASWRRASATWANLSRSKRALNPAPVFPASLPHQGLEAACGLNPAGLPVLSNPVKDL